MAAILAKKPSAAIGFSSVSEARSIINDIMDVVNIQQNFRVESTTQVDNAAAVIYQNTRYNLYNPSFINQLDDAARDKWSSISVIGHEIGHHLLGHTLDNRGSQQPKELEADEFSGLVLHKMGASLQQAQLAMRLIASPNASATHPGENDRLEAIAKGWNKTTVEANRDNTDVVVNTPDERNSTYPGNNPQSYPGSPNTRTYPAPGSRNNGPVGNGNRGGYPDPDSRGYGRRGGGAGNPMGRGNRTTTQSIMYEIRFNGLRAQPYYITSVNQVIMLQGNRPVVVAKVAATNRRDLPYVIYDDRQQIFIDRQGKLFAENGQNVGYLVSNTR
jgi:hypothetical protein